jgi:4-hydroxybenzoate polyprenyltransferase
MAGLLAAYGVGAGAYSLYLKRKTFVDVVALASLYTVRVLIGAAATGVTISPWFLAFSIFIFLSLAIVKRQQELLRVQSAGRERASGRTYFVQDMPVLAALAGGSCFSSVVVLALYINSDEVSDRYSRPEALWLLCPLVIYWLGRMVLLGNRGVVDDDPIVFAVGDRTSWIVALACVAVFGSSL